MPDYTAEMPPFHTRGYLPHQETHIYQAITLRLYDTLPQKVLQRMKLLIKEYEDIPQTDPRIVELRKEIDRYEDSGHGQCFLADSRIAQVVEQALLYHDGDRYELVRYCIMPNHLHVIVKVPQGQSIVKIIYTWKSYTAHQANKILSRSGSFWMQEYHDRYIRDENHFVRAIQYIDNNPVKAGLAPDPAAWRWSSAYHESLSDNSQ